MSNYSGVQTSVNVNASSHSTIYTANEVQRTNMEIVGLRGLDSRYMTSSLGIISRGYQTWITTRHLKSSILEIYDPRTDKVVETWNMCFDYDSSGTGDPRAFKTEINKLKDFASKLRKLPAGCRYRIIVELAEGAPEVPGWSYATLRDTSHLKKNALGGHIDTAKIKVNMEYWGET